MTGYALAYRLGFTPWERYGRAAAASIRVLLDREEAERSRPLGRAIDLGCGRGQYTPELARRGWEAVGVDNVPARDQRGEPQGRRRRHVCSGRCDRPPTCGPGHVRLLLRRRLLPGPQHQAASR
ncbi:MAG: methyltransferase domain-containing protein [Actinomycetes bacterium]